jgi:hypothetical protein
MRCSKDEWKTPVREPTTLEMSHIRRAWEAAGNKPPDTEEARKRFVEFMEGMIDDEW